jgi:hypothetical protein
MQPALSQERHIATARTLAEIQSACRVRAEELNISRETIDRIAGFAGGHAAKMLAAIPIKNLGATTLPLLLETLGLKLIVSEDFEALDKRADLRVPRVPNKSRARTAGIGTVTRADIEIAANKKLRAILKENARAGAKAVNESRTPEQRQTMARNAARARWKKPGIIRRKRHK